MSLRGKLFIKCSSNCKWKIFNKGTSNNWTFTTFRVLYRNNDFALIIYSWLSMFKFFVFENVWDSRINIPCSDVLFNVILSGKKFHVSTFIPDFQPDYHCSYFCRKKPTTPKDFTIFFFLPVEMRSPFPSQGWKNLYSLALSI